MAELITNIPSSALAVYAHPDDADVGCGGTLARWAAGGCQVHLVVCTDGGRGTRDPDVTEKALAAARLEELDESAGIVGLSSHEVLGWTDGELENGPDLRATLVRLIRQHRPEVVCGHDPTAVFFGQEYFNHRDHRSAGWALLDAISPAAALPHYFPEAGPPHQASTVYLSGTLEPDVWVDITSTIDVKAAAVECHRSQFSVEAEGGSPPGTPGEGNWAGDAIRRRAEEEGRRAGTPFAEGFRRLSLGG